MRKRGAVLAVLGLTAGILLAGCGQKSGGEWKANENSIYVTRAQEVQSALVYTSERTNELYQQAELEAFAEQAVIEYNEANGAGAAAVNEEGQAKLPVAVKSCTLEDRTGTLVFDYASPKHYENFAQATGDNTSTVQNIRVCRGTDGEAADILAEFDLAKADGKAMDRAKILKNEDYVIVAFDGAGAVCTEGKIAAMASDAAETVQRDDFTVVTGEGRHCIVFK